MKRLLIAFAVFFVVFSFGFVSAQSVCGSSGQGLFVFKSGGNSHISTGETTDSVYDSVLCYDSLFTNPYTGGSANVCDGSNLVLKLSGQSNAHAATPEYAGSGYDTNVCFGDLSCRTVDSGTVCNSGEATIGFLSGESNAHFSLDNEGGVYSRKICCSASALAGAVQCGDGILDSGEQCDDGNVVDGDGCSSACVIEGVVQEAVCGNNIIETGEQCDDGNVVDGDGCSSICQFEADITNSYWANGAGTVITTSYVGNTVFAIIESNYPENSKFPIKVWESDGPLPDDFIEEGSIVVDSSGRGSYSFTIDNAAVVAGGDESVSEFYFAIYNSEVKPTTSGLLEVDKSAVDPVDNFPTVTNTGNEDGSIGNKDETISFQVDAGDEEGPVTVEWDFDGDGVTDATGERAQYTFTETGQQTIIVTVTDSSGNSVEEEISLLIIDPNADGDYIFTYIEKPKHKERVKSDGLIVDFSGAESYAVRVNSAAGTIECLSGKCPISTIGGLSVIDPNSKRGTYNGLYFEWTASDGTGSTNVSGTGKKTTNIGFSSPGEKGIGLNLKYPDSLGSLSGNFDRVFYLEDIRQCSADGWTWREFDSNGNIFAEYDTRSGSACAGADGKVGAGFNADNCCAIGWSCSLDGSDGSRGCELVNAEAQCGDYTTQTSCEEDDLRAAENNVLWDDFECGTTKDGKNIICSCEWEITSSSCKFQKTERNFTFDSFSSEVCNYDSEVGECSQGFQSLSYTELCTGSTTEKNIECVKSSVQLPFFGLFNLIGAMVIIGMIYFIAGKR